MFFFCECWCTTVNTRSERVKWLGGKSEQTADNNNGTAISPYSWGPCTHTLSLEGPGPQPKNCGSVQWMAAIFRLSIVHEKQCVLGRLHLHKHPGTGQGPAARRRCSWRFLSHWCASAQKPCKSSHKIDTNAQGQINTRKKEAVWRHYTIQGTIQFVFQHNKKMFSSVAYDGNIKHFQSKKTGEFLYIWGKLK